MNEFNCLNGGELMNISVNWFCQVFFFFFLSQSFVSAISGSIKTKVVFFFPTHIFKYLRKTIFRLGPNFLKCFSAILTAPEWGCWFIRLHRDVSV